MILPGLLLPGLLLAGAAHATDVPFPKEKPRVTMTVPDGWTVAYTEIGVELRSPENDSLVVASILKHDMKTVDAWKAKVLTRMEAAGVTVGKDAAAAPPPNAPPPKPAETAAVDPKAPKDELPGNATTPSFSLAGGPSIDTPTLPTGAAPLGVHATKPTEIPGLATPGLASKKGARTINGLRFQSYKLLGGQFKDKPTDMQLVLYIMPKDEFFVVEQQSDSSDNRAAAILNSVKPIKR